MNLTSNLEYTISKIQEIEKLFKDRVPSISQIIASSRVLSDKMSYQEKFIEFPIPSAIKLAVEIAWLDNDKILSSTNVSETEKTKILLRFYSTKDASSPNNRKKLITYSNRLVRFNTMMARATELRIKLMGEINKILGNIIEFPNYRLSV